MLVRAFKIYYWTKWKLYQDVLNVFIKVRYIGGHSPVLEI